MSGLISMRLRAMSFSFASSSSCSAPSGSFLRRRSCHLIDLLGQSEKAGRELTREYYFRYAEMREDAFDHLCRANPDVSPHEVLASTQKLLDRILFCAFCEDRGLLPSETIQRAYTHADPYNPRPVWENFRGLFRGEPGQSRTQYSRL